MSLNRTGGSQSTSCTGPEGKQMNTQLSGELQ